MLIKTKQTSFSQILLEIFSKTNTLYAFLTDTRIITKLPHLGIFFKIFSNTYTKHFQKKSELAIKSPYITTYEKGANTFPFHNLPPELKKNSQRSFLFFSTFPLLDKRKVSGDSSNPHIYDKTQKSALSPYYRIGDSVGEIL